MGILRRKRRWNNDDDEAEVALSPLIDCVFLLLIFFLVTTMIKRKEKLIPIRLPNQTSAVAETPTDTTIIIGLDTAGKAYQVQETSGRDGELIYKMVGSLATHLKNLAAQQDADVFNRPLRIDCDRDTPFQVAIKALDICKLQGFNDVAFRTRNWKR